MAGLIMGIPMLLIILQPDMGTTITFIPPLIMFMFLAGMRFRLDSCCCDQWNGIIARVLVIFQAISKEQNSHFP